VRIYDCIVYDIALAIKRHNAMPTLILAVLP